MLCDLEYQSAPRAAKRKAKKVKKVKLRTHGFEKFSAKYITCDFEKSNRGPSGVYPFFDICLLSPKKQPKRNKECNVPISFGAMPIRLPMHPDKELHLVAVKGFGNMDKNFRKD